VKTQTLQRLERILVMVPWLLEHSGATVDEVTQRFGVSREDLADDLDVLGYCGLPGYGGGDLIEASLVGDRVVVRLADFFARPLRLSVSEAVTLLLAGRALGSVEGLPESESLRRAVDKLERALGGEAARVAVDLRAEGDELLAPLREAVAEGRVVHLEYWSASRGELTSRDVEPWAVVGHLGSWYLQGWCRQVNGARDFRLDRIRRMQPTDMRVEASSRREARAPVYEPAPHDTTVVIELAPEAAWLAEWVVADDVHHDGDRLRVRFRTSSLEWVARLVLQLGGGAQVISPQALADRVAQLAQTTLAGYGDAAGTHPAT
jgi:predicted DNA-binding transcriptional regulator YafY